MYSLNRFFLLLILFQFGCQTFQKNIIYKNQSQNSFRLNFHQEKLSPFVYFSLTKKGKPLKFIVDTGSNVSFLHPKYFKKDIDKKQSVKIQLILPSSKNLVQNSFLQKFSLYHKDKLAFKEQYFYSHSHLEKLKIDGLIGLDILSQKVLFFEYPNYVVFLDREDPFINEFIDRKNLKIPLDYKGDFLLLRLFSKKPYFYLKNIILDSGAGITVIKREFLKKQNLQKSKKVIYVDLSNQYKKEHSYILENLCVSQKECVQNLEVVGADFLESLESSEQNNLSGILGLNWFSKYQILIDSKEKFLILKSKK